MLHVVLCYQTWEENHNRSTGMVEEKKTRYAWASSKPLNSRNVFQRCTRIARNRWKIESHFLVEKHEGYSFEHVYSYDWQAMKGFHYLMKIGHFMNIMAVNSELLAEYAEERGIRGFVADLCLALRGAPLDASSIANVVNSRHVWKMKSAS